MKYFIVFTLLLLNACSVSRKGNSLEFERQSYERTAEGICKRPKRVILGLDLDYNVTSLQLKKDSIYGQLNYIGERLNPENNKFVTLPYKRILYIYKIDTANCSYRFLTKTRETGDFAIRFKNSSGVIGFSYYNLDVDNFNVVDAIIFHRLK